MPLVNWAGISQTGGGGSPTINTHGRNTKFPDNTAGPQSNKELNDLIS